MKKAMILSLLVGILLGVAVGWIGHTFQADKDLRAVLVSRDLERVSFAVNTLNMQADQPAKVEQLQLLILRSSLENLEELTRERIELPVSSPALRQGLERAGSYAKSKNLPDLAQQTSLVSKRLFGGA